MNERTIFMEALGKDTEAQRSAYLNETCGNDPALRQRVETLLQSHADAGGFLEKSVPERLSERIGDAEAPGATESEAPANRGEEKLAFLDPSDNPDSLGRLSHYEVLEIIGLGGMGIVLRAFDEKLHRVVAIKVMAAQLATNATARKRFQREAQAAAAVSHDHLVTIHAVDETNGLPYIAMQYVAGLSLQQRIDRDGPLQIHEILRIGMQTASGLAAAHAQGLIHRDIKPANILLENGVERVKITDFGLARAMTDASLTQSGVVAGTPQYMAPEQADGKTVDQRTDLFSLGSVLYAMCTGRAPFRASGTMAVLKRVCEEKPTPIRETNAEIPAWLVAIIDKLHAKDPAERYQSAAEVAGLLGRHLAHVQHPSVVGHVSNVPVGLATGWKPAPRRRRLAIAAAVLLCLLAGLSLTEATGVTKLRSSVIRIFTPDGTLVVEVDDPGVKVTVEGDGGLVISGAGLEEIRLRPGSYKVHAVREGKKVLLDREVVSISKGGREVVKVKLEASPAPMAAKTDPDRMAAEYVLSIGGRVGVNEENRDLKATADLPPEPFRLTSVALSHNKQVSDAGLAAFKDCKNLTHLYLGGTQVSNAGLAHFKDCKDLEVLWLHHTQVSDAGLVHFKDCKNLTSLHLAGTQVSDAGLAHFKDCKKLKALDLERTTASGAGLGYFNDCDLTALVLRGTQVDDAGLAHLKNCKSLMLLRLSWTQVSDAGLAHIKDCKNLTHLYLDKTQVSDVGLAHFKDFKNLKELTLSETQVSDTGLRHLAGLKNLDSLDVLRTKATTAGVAELQKALPECKIDWDGNGPGQK